MTDKPKRKSKDELQRIVSRAVREAVDYIESDIQEERLRAAKYFDGEVEIGHEEGRSKVVATKCRDAVRTVKPSLMRIFMQSDKPVEFVPSEESDVAIAEEQTRYAQYVYNRNGGFRLLNNVIDDALRQKTGIAKVYYREAAKSKMFPFEFGPDEFAVFAGNDNIEIIEHEQTPEGMHKGKAQQIDKEGECVLESLPPEEFFIDSGARSIEDFYVCGQRTEMRVGDLVEMGFDFDEVVKLGTDDDVGEEERLERKDYYDDDNDETPLDPSLKKVLYTEAYMRVDVEGTGVPQLYAFQLGGGKYELLDHYPVDEAPFAIFEIDPDPHTFFGRSLVDLIMDDQDAATVMLRGVLDNVQMTNAQRVAFDKNRVNHDDMMNGEIGGLIRVDGTPGDAMMPVAVPFAAGEILSAVQYYDETIDNKTGVTRASAGLDPDALRNATATAVDATSRAAMAQPEVMARHLAEGGMKRLFKLLAKMLAKYPPREKMARLNGVYTPVDPSNWNPDFDMTVNVGLGTGNEAIKIAALTQALETQLGLWGNYGPDNGLVTMTNIRNTLGDMLVAAGLHNTNRYYQPMDPEREAQLRQQIEQAEQAAAQQPPPPDPYVQGKQIEAQSKAQQAQMDAQTKALETQRRAQMDMMELQRKDDLERDQMLMDGILKAADLLGKYGVPVDLQALYRLQASN